MEWIDEDLVTEDNAYLVAQHVVKGIRYVKKSSVLQRSDLIQISWIEINRCKIGMPIGSTIRYVRMYALQCLKRQEHKYRREASITALANSSPTKRDLGDVITELAQIDFDVLSVDILEWLRVEVAALEGIVPNKQFTASKLFFLEDKSYEEVAKLLRCGKGTATCYISRTRTLLKERWIECQRGSPN